MVSFLKKNVKSNSTISELDLINKKYSELIKFTESIKFNFGRITDSAYINIAFGLGV